MYKIEFRPTAAAELRRLPAFVRVRLLSEMEKHVMVTPTVLGSRIKLICSAGGDRVLQFRVGDYRVFYDVDDDRRLVLVRGVARKGRKTTGEVL